MWRSTPAPHAGELPYSFLKAEGRTLVFCYRSTNVGFVNSSTSAASWIAYENAFIQDNPSRRTHRRLSLKLAHEHIARQAIDTQLYFQMNHASIFVIMMAAFILAVMPVNAAFQSVFSNHIIIEYSELCLRGDFGTWMIKFDTN